MRTLYRASRVHTMGHLPSGEWVLVDDRHIQRVGSSEAPDADRVVDLPGATILPGFIDTHAHLTSTGSSLANQDVAGATSKQALLAIALARAADQGDDAVVLMGFDESRWPDTTVPDIRELEAVTDRPLVIRRADGHISLANEAALVAARVLDEDGCERDAQGRLTGRVTRAANDRLSRWAAEARSEHRIEELQLAAAAMAASRGITCVHEMAMPHSQGWRDLEVFLAHRRRLPVDAVPIVATMDVSRVIDLGLSSIGGDLPADGSVGARTAALRGPYADGAGEGVTYYEDDELASFFHDGHAAGLQVGMHAIGDRAIEQVLTAWERVYAALDSRERRHFRARRHRVEHIEMVSAGQVERAASLGLAASVQPAFDAVWGHPGGLYERALGHERAALMNPFRTMLERGLVLGAGSDAPITPFDPWGAIAAMEHHHRADQALSRVQALRVHTLGGAMLAHQEEKKGMLHPGAHADFVAYDVDPLETPDIAGLRPILTVSLGREVFVA